MTIEFARDTAGNDIPPTHPRLGEYQALATTADKLVHARAAEYAQVLREPLFTFLRDNISGRPG